MNFGSLGIFLTLAFLLPGLVISAAAVVLFPEVREHVAGRPVTELLAIISLVAFFNGHPVFLLEHLALDRIWNSLHSKKDLSDRQLKTAHRPQILMKAEAAGISRTYYDQTFGEFILFTNTSAWTLALSVAACWRQSAPDLVVAAVAGFSLIALFYVAPTFKYAALCALEELDKETKRKASLAVSAAPASPLTKEQPAGAALLPEVPAVEGQHQTATSHREDGPK